MDGWDFGKAIKFMIAVGVIVGCCLGAAITGTVALIF